MYRKPTKKLPELTPNQRRLKGGITMLTNSNGSPNDFRTFETEFFDERFRTHYTNSDVNSITRFYNTYNRQLPSFIQELYERNRWIIPGSTNIGQVSTTRQSTPVPKREPRKGGRKLVGPTTPLVAHADTPSISYGMTSSVSPAISADWLSGNIDDLDDRPQQQIGNIVSNVELTKGPMKPHKFTPRTQKIFDDIKKTNKEIEKIDKKIEGGIKSISNSIKEEEEERRPLSDDMRRLPRPRMKAEANLSQWLRTKNIKRERKKKFEELLIEQGLIQRNDLARITNVVGSFLNVIDDDWLRYYEMAMSGQNALDAIVHLDIDRFIKNKNSFFKKESKKRTRSEIDMKKDEMAADVTKKVWSSLPKNIQEKVAVSSNRLFNTISPLINNENMRFLRRLGMGIGVGTTAVYLGNLIGDFYQTGSDVYDSIRQGFEAWLTNPESVVLNGTAQVPILSDGQTNYGDACSSDIHSSNIEPVLKKRKIEEDIKKMEEEHKKPILPENSVTNLNLDTIPTTQAFKDVDGNIKWLDPTKNKKGENLPEGFIKTESGNIISTGVKSDAVEVSQLGREQLSEEIMTLRAQNPNELGTERERMNMGKGAIPWGIPTSYPKGKEDLDLYFVRGIKKLSEDKDGKDKELTVWATATGSKGAKLKNGNKAMWAHHPDTNTWERLYGQSYIKPGGRYDLPPYQSWDPRKTAGKYIETENKLYNILTQLNRDNNLPSYSTDPEKQKVNGQQ